MKLLICGVSCHKDFLQVLLSSGIAFEHTKRAADKTTERDFDLILTSAKNKAGLKDVEKLRARFPKAWLVNIISPAWFKSPTLHNAILGCEAVDEVWIEDHWQEMFWVSYKRLVKQRAERTELAHLRLAHTDLTEVSHKLVHQIENDVALASNIQRSLLPKIAPDIAGVNVAIKYVPAAGSGGDYYDIFEFGDRKRFGILLADSKSHGMAAALLSTLLKVRLEEVKDRFPDSHSFVDYVNREIEAHTKHLAHLSLLYGILDRSSLSFRYTVAGNLRPVLWRAGKVLELPKTAHPPIGEMSNYTFTENEIALKPGDFMVLHTDGLDALTKDRSRSALVELLGKNTSPDPLELRNDIMALVDREKSNGKLKDDLTLIHLSVNERALYLANTK